MNIPRNKVHINCIYPKDSSFRKNLLQMIQISHSWIFQLTFHSKLFCNWRNSFGIHGFFCCFFHLNVSIKSPKCFCIHGSFQFSNTWIIISQEKICEKLFFTALSIDTSTAVVENSPPKNFRTSMNSFKF